MRLGATSAIVAGFIMLSAAARAEVATVSTDPASGIAIEAEGWTGLNWPRTGRDVGLIPVTVTITNGTDRERSWSVQPDRRFGSWQGVTSSAWINVPARGVAKTTLFMGGAANGSRSNFLKIDGFGVNGGVDVDCRTGIQASGSSGPNLPAGISSGVEAARGRPFDRYHLTIHSLDMARAPEDWRGWSSFRNLLLTEGEWQAMAGSRRKAMLDWIATGGRAGVLVADRAAERLTGLGFPASGPDGKRRSGAGEVVAVAWDGTTLAAKDVRSFLEAHEKPFHELLDEYHGSKIVGGWDSGFRRLVDVFGERMLPVGWILGFLTVFGIVAGPLNVMVFAGAGRRSRMFWTTPLISLAGTVFLLALMFFRDGVGGAGARRVLGLLAPEYNTMAITQEQFTRTGVLLRSSFPIDEPSWLKPVLDAAGYQRFAEVDGRMRQGDWFKSRSDQAFVATAVRPSRARIEVVGGTDAVPLAVISSIDVPLEKVFVIDEEGRYWLATEVGTGERKPLQASDSDTYQRWFESLIADAGPVRRQALERVRNVRGHAYATSPQASKVAVKTLGSIQWLDERADFAGPYTRSQP
jgi:hypothetical protein